VVSFNEYFHCSVTSHNSWSPTLTTANTVVDVANAAAANHYCYCRIEGMPYADAVISESLRLHLPAAILGFDARKDVVVGGVTVSEGTGVVISQSKTAVSDGHFTNAKQFWPEVR
jgi:cytochrome P450